jgi:hypothetical protein
MTTNHTYCKKITSYLSYDQLARKEKENFLKKKNTPKTNIACCFEKKKFAGLMKYR